MARTIQSVAIVGGGPTGLSAAFRIHELQPDTDVTVFEASGILGGVIQTVERDGFLIERGADSFITTKPAGVEICRRLGIADELIAPNLENRRSLIVRDGKPIPTPLNFHLLVPRSVQAVLDSPLLSTAGKLRFLQEAAVPVGQEKDESLADFTRRRFGKEFLERIVQSITAGIYSADPEELSMAASLPQFLAMEREHGSLIAAGAVQRRELNDDASGARYGLFASFPTGMQRLFQTLGDRAKNSGDVRLNSPVSAVRPFGNQWIVTSPSGEETFDAVIVAISSHLANDLLDGIDLGPISSIPFASCAIVVTGHHVRNVDHPLDAFGMVVPFCEGRPITAVSFASKKFPGRTPKDHVLIRTFIGGPNGQRLLGQPDELLVQTAMENLEEILGVRGEPVVSLVTNYPDASPQYTLGHLNRVAQIEAAVAHLPGLELAGASYRGVGLPDAIESGERAAERLFE